MAKEHPIIILWAHPRSMSTAFERIMRERGDFDCMHEPFMYYYYVHLGKKQMPFFQTESGRPQTFDAILALMQENSKNRPVFAKDMAYYVFPQINSYPELANTIRHVFLIRDPRKTILSYYRLDRELQCEEVGIEAQCRLHDWITETSGRAPPVVQAEQIQRDPKRVMSLLWQLLDVEYVDKAFHWQNEKVPGDWEQVQTWHEKTLSRDQIAPDRDSEEAIESRFLREATNAPQLAAYFQHHNPYYLKLLAYSEIFDDDSGTR